MRDLEFAGKKPPLDLSNITTTDQLKELIDQIVIGTRTNDGRDVGFELSHERLAAILKKIIDLNYGINGSTIISGTSSGNSPGFTVKGNAFNVAGPTADLTFTQVLNLLAPFIGSGATHKKGLVPDPGATPGNTKYLNEDGTFRVPPGAVGGNNILEIEQDLSIFRYEEVSGTPVIGISRAAGLQTITVTGGVIKAISLMSIGQTSDLDGSQSFSVKVNGVIGTALRAYPLVQKWNLSGNPPTPSIPDIADNDNTPQVQITNGVPPNSVTVRITNLNAFTNWAIKMVW